MPADATSTARRVSAIAIKREGVGVFVSRPVVGDGEPLETQFRTGDGFRLLSAISGC